MPRTRRIIPPGADYEISVVGIPSSAIRDLYHGILLWPWPLTLLALAVAYLAVNLVFAAAFFFTGGIAHAAPGSFADVFFFSIQTMGTIGYGAMYPESRAANVLVVAESIVGLIITALATGLIFAKFSRSRGRVMFSREAVISTMNGVPTLMFRLGNERNNQIVDCQIRVAMVRTEKTTEGRAFYRTLDLPLTRGRVLSLSRSWSVMHSIDASSPLHGESPESLNASEVEVSVSLIGMDDTTMQPVHAAHRYFARQIIWGAHHVDILSETPTGLLLDLRRFHDLEPTPSTPEFPYSATRP